MRLKSDAVDYKYFCEPNITPIKLSDEFVDEAIKTCPELYDAKETRYLAAASQSDADILLSDPKMAAYFEEGMPLVKAPKDLANFLIVEINGYLNKEVKTIAELR
jgi:aspartyl-tRNA(Asn)/glutamyl-tRNA(Gln) amidotransferase subunit B